MKYKHTLVKKGRTQLSGDEMFQGVDIALKALQAEQPEGVNADDIMAVFGALGDCAQILFDAHNAMRKAKGLNKLSIQELSTLVPDYFKASDLEKAAVLLSDNSDTVAKLAIVAGWSMDRAKVTLDSLVEDGKATKAKQ